jgi:HTH-type transcriptional regulator/antitoxin HigA
VPTKAKSAERGRYLSLVEQFPLRPIRSERELDRAIQMIDSLLDRRDLAPAEEDYLDVLGDLVERYEEETQPLAAVADAEMLRFLMQARGVSQSQMARETGIAVSSVCEILSGKRQLNRRQIGKLARYFHVEPGVFEFGEG